MAIAKLTANLLSTLAWRNKINEVIDATNTSAGSLNATLVDDQSSGYLYYGGGGSGSAWQVNKIDRISFAKTSATIANNSGVTTLSAAWTARTSLTYA